MSDSYYFGQFAILLLVAFSSYLLKFKFNKKPERKRFAVALKRKKRKHLRSEETLKIASLPCSQPNPITPSSPSPPSEIAVQLENCDVQPEVVRTRVLNRKWARSGRKRYKIAVCPQ